MMAASLTRRDCCGLLAAAGWSATALAQAAEPAAAPADPIRVATARRWVLGEFSPSTLSVEQQMQEMAFFIRAAEPYRGQRIYVVSETLPTHLYESRLLARAFNEITGIQVQHEVIDEGALVQRIGEQMRTGRNLYDAYVNDADFIGTHYRYDAAVALSDWISGEGAAVTLPTLDLHDFIGLKFTTGLDGKVYQLPDQQFANLYWFRHDWFQRPDLQQRFRQRHGYALGVPLNWKAYEDIADFFTNDVKELDGQRIWGHMDYGRKSPDLGWRFTDAWLAMAGVGRDEPGAESHVDEWGLRIEHCHAVGSSLRRGGALDGPAAVYALRKYLEWLHRYAPPEALKMDFRDAGPVPGRGRIAQQIFWYSAFTADLLKPGLPVVNADGTPKWRVAPSPHGAYWSGGTKRGYQDCGSWTLLKSTPLARRRAAWLYAQFTTCKSVSLRKTLVGLTPIRESDIQSESMSRAAPRLGGLVEFYRSPQRDGWSSTGVDVPDYARLTQLWWPRIAQALNGNATPQQVMSELAEAQDTMLARLQAAGTMKRCAPRLAAPREPSAWGGLPGAAAAKLADEEGRGLTQDYDSLMAAWRT